MHATSPAARRFATRSLLLAVSLVAATAGHAAPVFSDDFDANVLALNSVPTSWSVLNGTVDIVGGGFCLDGSAACIDLDGSTANAGELTRSFAATAGVTYSLSYQLSGNLRGGSDTVDVFLGGATQSHTLAAADALQSFSLTWLADATGLAAVTFANQGADNIGLLLDNVALADSTGGGGGTVPEPVSLALLGAGLAGFAWSTRRRGSR